MFSLAGREKEHHDRLKDFRRTADLDSLFKKRRPMDVPSGAQADENAGLLSAVVKCQDQAIELYQYLEGQARDHAAAVFFNQLILDKKTDRKIALTRLELEALKEGPVGDS
jgi:hypothetical protein